MSYIMWGFSDCEEELSNYFAMDAFILLNSDIKRLFPADSSNCTFLLMLYFCNNYIWSILLNSINIKKGNIVGGLLNLLPILK